jgi:hypothetical protein
MSIVSAMRLYPQDHHCDARVDVEHVERGER